MKNRKNKIVRLAIYITLCCLTAINLSAQVWFDAYGFPADEEILRSQYKDTVYLHDTLIVADIDMLVKISKENLKPFAKRYEELTEMIELLNKESADRVYYNFYLPHDSAHQLSNRFIIKEYDITENELFLSSDRTKDWDRLRDTSLIRKELLFHFGVNSELIHAFLKNKLLIQKTLYRMFVILAEQPGVVGINLYFPHYDFKEKRAMVQFVKSVRMLMDASRDFKPEKIRLNVTFADQGVIDRDYSYCLLQEAGEVLYINSSDLLEHPYVKGERVTLDNIDHIRFFPQLKNHFYIARYYMGGLDIRNANLETFSEETISRIINADYLENDWEVYLFILILLLLLIFSLFVLYHFHVPFSSLVNDNIESVLLIAIVLILEILAIIVSIFRNMCYNDAFTFMHKSPVLIFTLPLAMILIVPFLNGIAKKRRIP